MACYILRRSFGTAGMLFSRSAITNRAITSQIFSGLVPTSGRIPQRLENVARYVSVSAVRNSTNARNYATLWTAERALSLALFGIVPVGLLYPSQVGDTLMAVSIVMHQHWGLEAIVMDYVRPIMFGTTVPKLAHGLLLVISATTLGGLFYFNHKDIGIAGCVRKIWSIKPKNPLVDSKGVCINACKPFQLK